MPSTDRRSLEFWFDFASTYSYLTAMRIAPLAAARGVAVTWRPFLLGPIFKAQGWTSSPFNLYPAKGRYMIRDIQRLSSRLGLEFHPPESFPAHSVKAARIALVGFGQGWIEPFSREVFRRQFTAGADISDDAVLAPILTGLGLEAADVFAHAQSDGIKAELRAATDEATQRGIFGAPSFVTHDGELFWGDDRLEQALDWACSL